MKIKSILIGLTMLAVSGVAASAGSLDGYYVGVHGIYDKSKLSNDFSVKSNKFTGGAYMGYNGTIQDKFFWGIESGVDKGTSKFTVYENGEIKKDWTITSAAKLGYYITDEAVAYGIVGYDFSRLKDNMGGKENLRGLKYGFGTEQKMNKSWSMRAELVKTDLKKDNLKLKDMKTTIGLNYRF